MRSRIAIVGLLLFAGALGGWAYLRQAKLERGQQAFRRLGCGTCHLSGGAPNLSAIAQKYDQKTLARFIENPETIYRERGKRPLNPKYFPMPNPHASPADADAIAAYLFSASQ